MPSSLQTPRFLKASNPKQLEREMLRNNLKRQRYHEYQIVFDGNAWFAWFYVDLSGSYNQEIQQVEGQASSAVVNNSTGSGTR